MSKLLVVIGALEDEDYVKHVVKCVATGIDEWLRPSPLHSKEEIENILNSIPLMKSIPNRNAENGSVVSRFKGRILDTTILINPTLENLHYEFIDLLRTASHCLVAFGGFASEREGDWILQDGLFSLDNILHTLKDSKVLTSISVKKTKIAISCHKIGQWKKESMNTVDQDIHLEIIDSSCQENGGEGDAMNTNNRENHIGEFTSFLEDGIANEIDTIFNSLKPPCREGFIKTSNPCLYIFPGGHGDSAFFAINGFNMLVNGGSTCKPSFWKLIQHIDRVDSILATHLGVDNLPGINSFLMRKLQERQIKLPIDNTTEDYQELRRCLISPNLGPMFFNAPVQFFESLPKSSPRKNIAKPDNDEFKLPNGSQDQLIFKASDVVKDTIRLSKALNLQLKPLRRKPGLCEPITLFSKFGCGKLDMYVLNPIDGSKELKYMNEKWGIGGQTEIPFGKNGVSDPSGVEGMSSYADLCSISVLLVWHPSDPNERIVRVLFPGNASQIFEGLEGIKELPFMKMQHATGNTIQEARVASKMTETVPAQKSSRPASSTARVGISQRRLVSGKKSTLGSMGSLVKESSTCEVKTSDKRPKNDKTMTKPKAVAAVPSKTVPAKDKAVTTKSARSATGQVSSKAATAVPASSSTAKKVQSTAGNKSEAKRPASAKSSTLKTKPTEKTTERSKKPVPVVHKTKVETSKTSVRKSPRQAPKKPTCTKIPHEKVSKKTKATPPPPPAVEAIPIENISADMDKPTMKTTGSPIKDSEEVSVLPMRRSPEGGDASPPRYIAPSTVEITELDEPQPLSSEQVVKSDTGVANRQFATIPSISEESDMISTNGSSALTMQRTPVGDTTFASDVIKLEEQFLSSDKSITDEHQDQGEIDEIVPSSIELSGKDAEEDPVRITDPVDCNEGLLPDCESLGCAVEAATSPIAAAHDTCVIGAIQSKGSGCDKAIGESEASEPGASAKVEVSMPFVDTGDNNPQGQDLGSDMHSLSSVEGSYELYPVAKSPPPVSTQETIAETISEFKLDELVLKTEEHCTVADSKLHQMEEAEDQAVCTEELDTHVDSTTWLSGSAVARIDPPFTSTDVSHSLQEAVPQQEFAQPYSDAEILEQENRLENDGDETRQCETSFPVQQEEDPSKHSNDPILVNTAVKMEEHGDEKYEGYNDAHFINGPLKSLVCQDGDDSGNQQQNDLLDTTQNNVVQCGDISSVEQEMDPTGHCSSHILVNNAMDIEEDGSGECESYDVAVINRPTLKMENLQDEDNEQNDIVVAVQNDSIQYRDISPTEHGEDLTQHSSGHIPINAEKDYEDHDDEESNGFNVPCKMEVWNEGDVTSIFGQNDLTDANKGDVGMYHIMNEGFDPAADTSVKETLFQDEKDVASIQGNSEGSDVDEGAVHGETEDAQDLYAKSTEHEQVEENFDLHSSQVAENKASKDTEPDYMAVQDSYERDEFQVMQGYSPSHEASSPGMYEFDSKVSEGDDNLLHAGFDSQLSDPEAELLLATEREFDEALLQGADIKDYEPVKSSTLQISDCSEPGVAEEFNLHGGDEPEFSQERGMAEGASFGDPDKQALMSGGTQEAETSGQQINILACADPLAPLADTNELETDILQSDARKFDSPLNASALPFIPSTMQSDPLRPDDVNQGEEMLITTDAMRGTAPMVSTTSTNPFLMEILADSQPTQLEPKEVIAPPTRGSDPCAGQDKFGKSSVKKSSARKAPFSHIYVDLAYVPNHGDKSSVGPEFFKKIRARYYVISGSKQSCDQPSTEVLNHLLQGRKLWFSESGETASHEDSNVTVIPTHDTPSMKEWYNNNFKELENYNIHMVASGSKVLMQAESIEACKIEF